MAHVNDSDTVYVFDLLVTCRSVPFVQIDDTDSHPVNIGGGWHLPGRCVTMDSTQLDKSLSNVSHLYSNYLRGKKKISVPPIPRYFFGVAVQI